MRVLIVDDDPVNRRLLGAMLDVGGVTGVHANSAHEAFTVLDGPGPLAAILMDLRMPGMDGLDAIRQIRARADDRANLPIAIVTADTAPDLPDRCREAGADDLIRKPLNMGDLHEALGRLLTARNSALILS